ncbi:hypothetical protein DH2020_036217 [Rehmannia glutinosa]|uniref:LIM zinc-binding domain-containing protein n=1 Tax=Rehmannia glutinosa TaxID=99300 RepID=A0ABR0V7E1_REHGL
MAFYGTTQKCKACDKTVHFVEMMSADGVPYHKTCFKCTHCSGRLAMSNYSAVEGQLYCKPHFEQLFKETGSFTSKKFQPCPWHLIYPTILYPRQRLLLTANRVTMEGEFYHKSCFRCAHGGCFLTTSSYAALDGILYCKPHFAQLFKEKGSYTHLTKTASLKKNAAEALNNLEIASDDQNTALQITQEA